MTALFISPDEAIAMRLPRARFTVRGMMILVAGVAVILWGVAITGESRRFRSRADLFDTMARTRRIEIGEERQRLVYWERLERQRSPASVVHAEADRRRRKVAALQSRAEHYAALAIKYRRAARFPWLSVATDPPEPK